jgi:hypothetical protein
LLPAKLRDLDATKEAGENKNNKNYNTFYPLLPHWHTVLIV